MDCIIPSRIESKLQRYTSTVLLGALMVLVCHPALAQSRIEHWQGQTMGPIVYNVKVVVPNSIEETELSHAQSEVQSVLNELNQRMSTYLPDSEISQFNNSQSTDWFVVSADTARVVNRALEISRDTGGAFDVTVKPVVERWNFGAGKKEFTVPTEIEVKELLGRIGYEKLDARLETPALKKSSPDVQVDLSAIAKGFAVDLVCERLSQLGYENYFVEIGGEVRVLGRKPDNSKWVVGIEQPLPDRRESQNRVELDSGALATSGDYRNFIEIGGERYTHTIDPKTAMPVQNQMASASVLAEDCMTADAYATALMVLGKSGQAQAEAAGHSVMLMEHQGTGLIESHSPDFPIAEPSESMAANPILLFAIVSGVFILVVAGMAVGAVFAKKPITGSCGGLGSKINPDGSSSCGLCQKPSPECLEKRKSQQAVDI